MNFPWPSPSVQGERFGLACKIGSISNITPYISLGMKNLILGWFEGFWERCRTVQNGSDLYGHYLGTVCPCLGHVWAMSGTMSGAMSGTMFGARFLALLSLHAGQTPQGCHHGQDFCAPRVPWDYSLEMARSVESWRALPPFSTKGNLTKLTSKLPSYSHLGSMHVSFCARQSCSWTFQFPSP